MEAETPRLAGPGRPQPLLNLGSSSAMSALLLPIISTLFALCSR